MPHFIEAIAEESVKFICLFFDKNCRLVNTVNQHADVTGVQPCTTPWESPSDFCGFSPS